MKRVQRLDNAGTLRAPAVRSDGSVMYEAVAIEAGILEYAIEGGGVRRELVTMDMLERTAGDLARRSCTLKHPGNGHVFVTRDNADQLAVGDVNGEVIAVRDEDNPEKGYVKVQVCLRRADAIEAAARQPGVSCGYHADTDEKPGVHPVFGSYDAVQTNRYYNHLAIGVEPRCASAVLRADGASIVATAPSTDPAAGTRTQEPPVAIRDALVGLGAKLGVSRLDAADPELVAAIAAAVESLQSENEDMKSTNADMEAAKVDMEKKIADMTADIEAKTGERDAMKAELDAMKAAEADAAYKADMERADSLAKALNVDVSKCDSLKAKKLAIVQSRGMKLDSADDITDERLDGMFEVVHTLHADQGGSRSDWGDFHSTPEKDDNAGARADAGDSDFGHPYMT